MKKKWKKNLDFFKMCGIPIQRKRDSPDFDKMYWRRYSMKKSLLIVAAAAATVIMTGCMATHTNDGAAPVKVCVKAPEFKADVVAGQTAVSGEATVHNLFNLITWGVSDFADDAFVSVSALPVQLVTPADQVAKQGATYKACQAAKADVILAAKYKLDIKDFFVYKSIKCKVTGYPGTIKGVK